MFIQTIQQWVLSVQVLSFIVKFTYIVFSYKHYIAPVKIDIIFIYRCTGKPLNLQLAASHRNFFYHTQKFILNKNGDTEKFVSVTQ